MHKVAILTLPDVVLLDLSIPVEIFSRARTLDGKPCYQVHVCGISKTTKSSALSSRLGLSTDRSLAQSLAYLSKADTIVIPGTDPVEPLPKQIRQLLVRAHQRGVRLISICSGAFHLAETGLLNGRAATTHWMATDELQKRYPEIKVNPNVLYVDEGSILTSAGVCAGIDLCLHVVRKDFGAAVAAQSARFAVMPLERSGGQAQHIVHAMPSKEHGSLTGLLDWMEANLDRNLSLEMIAKKAGMSIRTLNRQFKNQTGTSPIKWILKSRIRRARVLLETTEDSMEEVAASVGFGSSITMREHFRAIVHTSPRAYRESFRGI